MKAEYVISSPTVGRCPNTDAPEYAFIGRSNVGKSSLINMITNHKNLAKTSALPGKTLLINHFRIDDTWYIVDLPGYGYAKRSKTQRDKLDQMIRSYILGREQLACVFVLIDIRLEPQKIDREFIDWLGQSGIPFVIIFTKADKITGGRAKGQARHWMKSLEDTWEELPPYFISSSERGTGREEILQFIASTNETLR